MPLRKVTSEVAEVTVLNASVLGITTFTELEQILKIVLLILTIGYTIYKWLNHKK